MDRNHHSAARKPATPAWPDLDGLLGGGFPHPGQLVGQTIGRTICHTQVQESQFEGSPRGLGRPDSEQKRTIEAKTRDFVCQDQGKVRECGKFFKDQCKYIEHVKTRNLARDLICPNKKTKPPLKISLSDEDEDEVVFLSPQSTSSSEYGRQARPASPHM